MNFITMFLLSPAHALLPLAAQRLKICGLVTSLLLAVVLPRTVSAYWEGFFGVGVTFEVFLLDRSIFTYTPMDEKIASIANPRMWKIPFYGNDYMNLRVGTNGVLLFGEYPFEAAAASHCGNDWDNLNDCSFPIVFPMIAAFWTDFDPSFQVPAPGSVASPGLYYSGVGGTGHPIVSAANMIMSLYGQASGFTGTCAFTAVWYKGTYWTENNVPFKGENTVILTVVSDQKDTYVILNYPHVSWGSAEYGYFSTIGFNRGDNISYHSLYDHNYDAPGRYFTDDRDVDGYAPPGVCSLGGLYIYKVSGPAISGPVSSVAPLSCGTTPTSGGMTCFPGKSEAEGKLPGVRVRMQDMKIGDVVLAVDAEGNPTFTRVIGFLDKHANVKEVLKVLATKSGKKLSVSPKHLVAIMDQKLASKMEFRFAEDTRVGDFLLAAHAKGQLVQDLVEEVGEEQEMGKFAPLTEHGTIVVDGVLASSYANLQAQRYIHWLFSPLRLAAAAGTATSMAPTPDCAAAIATASKPVPPNGFHLLATALKVMSKKIPHGFHIR